jgi:hypothetical protein
MENKPPKIYFDTEKDPLEGNMRMGCATVFGICFAIYVTYRLFRWTHFPNYVLYILIVLAVIFIWLFAYLALRDGDSFWRKILNRSSWF